MLANRLLLVNCHLRCALENLLFFLLWKRIKPFLSHGYGIISFPFLAVSIIRKCEYKIRTSNRESSFARSMTSSGAWFSGLYCIGRTVGGDYCTWGALCSEKRIDLLSVFGIKSYNNPI